jgi:hypothetical protein
MAKRERPMAHPSKGNPLRDEIAFGTTTLSTLDAQNSEKGVVIALSRIKVRSFLGTPFKSLALAV